MPDLGETMPIRLPSGSNAALIPVGLGSTKLLIAAESSTPETFSNEVEILRSGSFDFGVWMENIIKVDDDLLDAFIANYVAGARGKMAGGAAADLPIDIDHETRDAAGWITALARVDGRLMASIKWNALGVELIAGDRFRFMSVMFQEDYKDPEGKKWGPTIWGAAMTNYPRIMDMDELTLSAREVGRPEPPRRADTDPTPTEDTDMDPKRIAKALGIPEDAPEEALLAAITEGRAAEGDAENAATKTAAQIEALTANVKRLDEREAERTTELATMRATACIDKHERDGRLTPGMLVDAEGKPSALAKLASTDLESFDEIVGAMAKAVAFGAVGNNATTNGASDDPTAALDDAIVAKMAANGIGHEAAMVLVASETPELMAAAYPEETAVKNRV